MKCLLHVGRPVDENIVQFSEKSLIKVKECMLEWEKLDGDDAALARRYAEDPTSFLHVVEQSPEFFANYGYHRSCYSRFTNKTNLLRAKKRQENREQSLKEDPALFQAPPPSPKRTRLQQSVGRASSHGSTTSRTTMPVSCIICKRKTHYTTRGRKRLLDKLCLAETVDGGEFMQ